MAARRAHPMRLVALGSLYLLGVTGMQAAYIRQGFETYQTQGRLAADEESNTDSRKLLEVPAEGPSSAPSVPMPLPLPLPMPFPVPQEFCVDPTPGSVWGNILQTTSLAEDVPGFNVTIEQCLQGQDAVPEDVFEILIESCCQICIEEEECTFYNLNLCTLECLAMSDLTDGSDGLFLPLGQYVVATKEALDSSFPDSPAIPASFSVSDELIGGLFVLGLVLFILFMGCACFCKASKDSHLYSAIVVEADMDKPLEEEAPAIVIPSSTKDSDEGLRSRSIEKKASNSGFDQI